MPVPNTTPVIAAEYAAFISDYVYILKRHIKVCCSLLLKKLFSNFIFYVFFALQLPNALLLPTLLFFFQQHQDLREVESYIVGSSNSPSRYVIKSNMYPKGYLQEGFISIFSWQVITLHFSFHLSYITNFKAKLIYVCPALFLKTHLE